MQTNMARKKTTEKAPSIDFEGSLQTLETFVNQMESGKLSLEESLKTFEQGVALTRQCQHALSQAEQRVSLLIENNGALKEVPFHDDEAE